MNSIGALCAGLLAAMPAASAENWPQFRGSEHNYLHTEQELPHEWGKDKNIRWTRPDAAPEFASPLLYKGTLYVFGRHRGSVGCFDPNTGERLPGIARLPGARSFWSSPWAHDGKVFCVDEAGTTFVISAGPKVELIGSYALNEEVRASPALTHGVIILRARNTVYCIAE